VGCLAAVSVGCKKDPQQEVSTQSASPTKRIFAVSYPLQFLTRSVAGEEIEVLMPYGKDEDPKTARPSRDAIAEMQSADLIVANGTGATYVGWLATVSLPDSKVVNTATRGLSLKEYIAVENASIVHSHGPEGEHSHPVMASRTWLDPALAKKQANYISKQLKRVYPDQTEAFDANLKSLNNKLDGLSENFETLKTQDLAVFSQDASFKFFSRAVGVEDQILTWFNKDLEPKSKESLRTDLEKQIASFKTKPKFLLVKDDLKLTPVQLEVLQSIEIKPLVLDSLDKKPDEGDFITALQSNVEIFSRANTE